MPYKLVKKLSALWISFILVVVIGNEVFSTHWEVICEVLQIFCVGSIIYLSIRLLKILDKRIRNLFKYFTLSMISLFLSGILYFIVNFKFNIADINHMISLIYLLPSVLWISLNFIFWGKLTWKNRHNKNNWVTLITIALVNLCLFYVLSKVHIKPASSMATHFLMFQVYTNILSFFIINCSLHVLICTQNIGLKLLAAGTISLIGANFLTSYLVYTYNPSMMVYRNEFWLFGSCILVSSLLYLLTNKIDVNFYDFPKNLSIKSIMAAWTLSIVAITTSLLLILADYFGTLSSQVLSILPYLMFVYIVFAVLASLLISYIFESSIIHINKILKEFMQHPLDKPMGNDIRIDEFVGMQNFIIYTMHIIDEKNKIDRMNRLTSKVAHDIRSPLASLLVVVKSCTEIPEQERIVLREAATTIGDIANSLLINYKEKNIAEDIVQPTLVSSALLQVLTEKKYQYQSLVTRFEHEFDQKGSFVFINIEPTSFKRSISNIINNSVDALYNRSNGIIKVELKATEKSVIVSIQDNGNGMPDEVRDNILQNIAIISNKKNGYGIGFTQINETLAQSSGRLEIKSGLNYGTRISLVFPKAKTPSWMADHILLNPDDIVVILDDEPSIHGAWDQRFKISAPDISLTHFTFAQPTIDFINSLIAEEKQRVFLLTDYELLKQDLNGLDVIRMTAVKRAILVTSHYADKNIHELIQQQANTKILPKTLTSEVQIKVSASMTKPSNSLISNCVKGPYLVFIDDDKMLIEHLMTFVLKDKVVDKYHEVQNFLDHVSKYSKDTKFLIDNNFSGEEVTGIKLAQQLHDLGYTQLFLFSGTDFSQDKSIPDYLQLILKSDINAVAQLANG